MGLTAAILSHAVGGISAMQEGPSAANTLLPDEGASGLLIVVFVQTGEAGAGVHARTVLLASWAPQSYRMGDEL